MNRLGIEGQAWPEPAWQRVAAEAVGWSLNGLAAADAIADEIGTAAFMVVEGGVVVHQRGPVAHRYMCHSIRKSLLSALFGIYVAEGRIDLSATLATLGIDDKEGLTDRERLASVNALLMALRGLPSDGVRDASHDCDARGPPQPRAGNVLVACNTITFAWPAWAQVLPTAPPAAIALLTAPAPLPTSEPAHGDAVNLRRFSPLTIKREWRRLVSLVCLVAFVFVAVAHAGHHLASVGKSSAVVAMSASGDTPNDGDGLSKDRVCVFCALVAAELHSIVVVTDTISRQRVETFHHALAPSTLAAESPPPIA